MLSLIAGAVGDRSARGIASAVGRLVTDGRLPAGARLPTVRDVARALGVSPTTVSEAWGSLTRAGAIRTRGRSGTYVTGPAPGRYVRIGPSTGGLPRDLSTGVPDHDLLPGVTGALSRIGDGPWTTSYRDRPVLPELEAVLRERWPFPPERITVVDGALDALDRIIAATVRYGDRVVVEDPAFPPLLDLLDTAGATVLGVPVDAAGMDPAALAAALAAGPVAAVFLQPRAHNPTGASMTPTRAAALATVLSGPSTLSDPSTLPDISDLSGVDGSSPASSDIPDKSEMSVSIVVEDDHGGDIAAAAPISLGAYLPGRTVHVASFSKSHGPDLRLAAIGGCARVVDAVAERRLLGPGWSSRLLQAVLADLLTDPAAVARVAGARAEYGRRRSALLAGLHARGVTATAADGINLWMSVNDQQAALVSLAGHGVAVAPGRPFCLTPRGDFVRVTCGLVRDGHDDLAALLADAATGRALSHGWR